MRRKIEVNYGLKKRITKAMNCTYPTIKMALEYRSDTKKAKQIRQYALNNGGTEYILMYTNVCTSK